LKRSTFAVISLEGALLSFNVACAAALIPSIAREFALSQFVAGRIVWVYMLTYGVSAFLYGPLVRRFDARRVELVCVFFFSLANLLTGLALNLNMLIAGRFLMGFFGSSVIPLGLILVARHVDKEARGRYIGVFFGATFIASLLGLFLSGIINWRLIFLIPALAGLVLWIAMYFYLPSFKEDAGVLKFNYIRAFSDRAVFKILAYIFLVSLIYHAIQQWLGVYFSTQLGLNQFAISMLITLTSLSGIFGEFWGGRLTDSLGRKKVVNLGVMLMFLSIILLVLKPPLLVMAVPMVIWGLGWTFNHVGLATMLTDLPQEFLNEAASLNSGVRFISGGLGVGLGGLIMSRSFSFGFLAFGGALVFLLLSGRLVNNK
jgi:predicted MFS family arabinose efflux permease